MYQALVIGASIGVGGAVGLGIAEVIRRQRRPPRYEENSYCAKTGLLRGTGALEKLPTDAYVKDVFIENVPFASKVHLLRNRALSNLATITITDAALDDATFKRAMEALPKIPPIVDASHNNITDVSPAITPETNYFFSINNKIDGHKLAEFVRKYPHPVKIDVLGNRNEWSASEIQEISDSVRHSCAEIRSKHKEIDAAMLQRNSVAHAAYRQIDQYLPDEARDHIAHVLTHFNPRSEGVSFPSAYHAAIALADIINGEHEGTLRGLFAPRQA